MDDDDLQHLQAQLQKRLEDLDSYVSPFVVLTGAGEKLMDIEVNNYFRPLTKKEEAIRSIILQPFFGRLFSILTSDQKDEPYGRG